ncbi:Nucleoside-diphosphate-sugar epimerase [Enhydrobacter aerosaccus]|uniref:Nucleoside-diphosphate-sugar epimerase n=1 Tax=Enhydrobacter aerosaccus TaxID=225324 RepID=A0A1T4T6Z1_9HYPH|nr:Nucleoside-diphosphate-sugar epimerase [Enhydrobacter aerosaccus]
MSVPPSVLVTGASGFIGRHVVNALSRTRWDIHCVARRGLDPIPDGVVWHEADLLEPGTAGRLVRDIAPAAIVHLAWNATPGTFWESPDNLDWVAASIELYRAFARSGGKRAVFAGTCAEYDWSYENMDELETPLLPRTLYGISKSALFELLNAACSRDGVEFAWARLFYLYGPFEDEKRLVPDVIRALIKGTPAACGPGVAERDFMHVEDVAKAIVAILEDTYCGPVNVASGRCVPLREIIQEIGRQVGRPELIQLGARPAPPNEPQKLFAATTVLRERIGFCEGRGLTEGLAETINWWRKKISDVR